MNDETDSRGGSNRDKTLTRPGDASRTLPTSDGSLPSAHDDVAVRGEGARVGRYMIESLLGVGGMGAVYRATQESPHRTVALKLMKPELVSARALRRFELESEVLGRLSHPGIASIHEAGVHEGAPFFAMEYVDGPTLTEYAASHGLGVRERLALFMKICDAVQHAHAKGIIHRDLKPHNILVAEVGDPPTAQPKVLDFGVARATDEGAQRATMQTDIGQLVGTIPYMSPEQVAADPDDIDTRSDVYALGVVLYELLAGRMPYDIGRKMIHEAARVIQEDAPTRLSSISTTLRGDVETIVLKALEKERDRRYQSALDLGSDIRRYLDDEPILARPPSAWYQLRKFSKRNRALVVGSCGVVLALVAGLAGTSYGLVEANTQWARAEAAANAESEQRGLADKRAREAEEAQGRAEAAQKQAVDRAKELALVSGFQGEQLGSVDVRAMGEQLRDSVLGAVPEGERDSVSVVLADVNFTDVALGTLDANIFDRTLAAIDDRFGGVPLIQAILLDSVGRTMLKLGLNERAEGPLRRALDLRRDALGASDELTLASMNELSTYLIAQGRYAEAEPLMREAIDGIRALEGDESQKTLTAIGNLGIMLMNQNRLGEAEPLIREAAELSRRMLGDWDPETLKPLANLGELLRQMGRLDEAASVTGEALEGARAVLGDTDPLTLTLERNMGGLLFTQGKLDESEAHFVASLEGYRTALGSDHPDTLTAINNLALLRNAQKRYEDAERLWREALDGFSRTFGDAHPEALTVCYNLGYLLDQQGNKSEAEPLYRRALAGFRSMVGPDHPRTLLTEYNLARLLAGEERYEEARSLAQDLVDRTPRVFGPTNAYFGTSSVILARACLGLGDLPAAEAAATGARTMFSATLGDAHGYTVAAMQVLLQVYTARAQAEPGAGFAQKAEEVRKDLDAAEAKSGG